MSIKKSLIILIPSALLILSGCPADPKLTGPSIPRNTIGSFNFVVNPDTKKSSLVIFDQKGNQVTPKQEPLPPNAKLVYQVTIKFNQVNPCYAEIGSPDSPPLTIKISDGDCPAGF